MNTIQRVIGGAIGIAVVFASFPVLNWFGGHGFRFIW